MKVEKLDPILDSPQILYPSRRKWIFIGLIFGMMSLFMILILIFYKVPMSEKMGAMVGFILVTGFSIFSFLIANRKASYFRMSNKGFENSFCYIKKSFLWKDITEFGVHIILNGKIIIGFNVREGYQDTSFFMKTTNGKAFEKMFQHKYKIQDNYGYNPIDLINHLNYLKDKFK